MTDPVEMAGDIYMYIYMWLWQATNLARRKSIYKWAKKKSQQPKSPEGAALYCLGFLHSEESYCSYWWEGKMWSRQCRTGPIISGSTLWQGQFTVLWNNPLMLVACSWEQESVLSPSSWQWLNKWQACQTSLLQGQWTWCIHHSREKSICVGHVYSLLAETMAYLIQEFSQGICWRF